MGRQGRRDTLCSGIRPEQDPGTRAYPNPGEQGAFAAQELGASSKGGRRRGDWDAVTHPFGCVSQQKAPILGGHTPTHPRNIALVKGTMGHGHPAGEEEMTFICFGSHNLSGFANLLLLQEDHPLSS